MWGETVTGLPAPVKLDLSGSVEVIRLYRPRQQFWQGYGRWRREQNPQTNKFNGNMITNTHHLISPCDSKNWLQLFAGATAIVCDMASWVGEEKIISFLFEVFAKLI